MKRIIRKFRDKKWIKNTETISILKFKILVLELINKVQRVHQNNLSQSLPSIEISTISNPRGKRMLKKSFIEYRWRKRPENSAIAKRARTRTN